MTAALAQSTRDRLLAVPARVAPLLAGDDTVSGCGRIVDDAIRAALEDMAREDDEAIARLEQAEAGRPG